MVGREKTYIFFYIYTSLDLSFFFFYHFFFFMATENYSKSLPNAGLSSVTINNTLYLYGDKKPRGSTNVWFLSAHDISNLISPTPWMHNTSRPVPNLRYSPGLVIHDHSILVFSSNGKNTTSVYILNVSDTTWSTIQPTSPTVPLAKKEYAIASLHDDVYLFGGLDQPVSHTLHDFWIYRINSNTWDSLLSPYTSNTTRCGHTSSMLR